MSEPEQLIDSVHLALRDRVQPVVPCFPGKDHQGPRFNEQVDCLVAWVFEVHCGAALETERCKDFLEGRVGVDMGRDALARHVVVRSHLVKVPKPSHHIVCCRLIAKHNLIRTLSDCLYLKVLHHLFYFGLEEA